MDNPCRHDCTAGSWRNTHVRSSWSIAICTPVALLCICLLTWVSGCLKHSTVMTEVSFLMVATWLR